MSEGFQKYYYKNEYLFSEIYLEEITQNPDQEEIHASLKTLKEYREYADTISLKTWKDTFLHQVLYALGFNLKSESDHLTLLFPMGEDSNPISLIFCLLPSKNLDNTTMGRNWSEKIIRNLREHNMQWGLLTNGDQWRVYHLDEPTPYETYLELDLSEIFKTNAYHAFQIFYKFMRVENFQINEEDRCQFDIFKKDSQDKIAYIENELANALKQKEEGGQGVLSSICMGYVEFMRQNGTTDFDDEDLRKKIYHGAMLYMFRLLFLYYADSRGLLSDQNHDFLSEIRQKAHNIMHKGYPNGESYQLWNALEDIFVDIDQTYNGGLFNPHESEFTFFIEDSKLHNTYLAPAIYHLAYYHEASGEEREVSYKDMSVRHLGTLYEGLLEHKLFVAKEDTEVIIQKNSIQFKPTSLGGKPTIGNIINVGQVYFGNEKNERRKSGSFYTPEHIVNTIVKNALSHPLENIESLFIKIIGDDLLHVYRTSINEYERSKFEDLLYEKINTFFENELLSISVVDPAMGSGHFLVNASNYISNFVTRLFNKYQINIEYDTNTKKFRRLIVENCIYGVDVNPIAVELAKLSLWILTMKQNSPLSFLNHHLKTGNSLIGIQLNSFDQFTSVERNEEFSQLSLFQNNFEFERIITKSINNYLKIKNIESMSISDVSMKRSLLYEINDILKPYKMICNFLVDRAVNDDYSDDEYLHSIESSIIPKRYKSKLNNYFHWELEFPDIFLYSNGFTCVIGNPPYIEVKKINEVIKEYLWYLYKDESSDHSLLKGRFDIYWAFILLSTKLLRDKGVLALLTSDSYGSSASAKSLRRYLLDNFTIEKIVNFGKFSKDVSVTVWMMKLLKEHNRNYSIYLEDKDNDTGKINSVEKDTLLSLENVIIDFNIKYHFHEILRKYTENSLLLGDILYLQQGMIIQSKYKKRDEYIFSKKLGENFKRYIEGKDVSHYRIGFDGKYLDYKPNEHHRSRIQEVFLQNKLLVKRIANKIQCVVDFENYFTDNTLFTGTLFNQLDSIREKYSRQLNYSWKNSDDSKMFDYYSLCSILNSRFLNFYNTNFFGGLSLTSLRKLPLPNLTKVHASLLQKISKILHFAFRFSHHDLPIIGVLSNLNELLVVLSYNPQEDINLTIYEIDKMIPDIQLNNQHKENLKLITEMSIQESKNNYFLIEQFLKDNLLDKEIWDNIL